MPCYNGRMNITVLGSGCWEGTPAPFCECSVCTEATKNPLSIENRTRPEVLVETNEGKFLIELSPDIRTQVARHKTGPIDSFLLSHWHFDHLFGLYELHAWIELVLKKAPTIYCSEQAAEFIKENIGFIPTNLSVIRAYESFNVCGATITPLPVYHMYGADNDKHDTELDNTFAFLIEHEGAKVAYMADFYRVPARAEELLKGVDTVITDGTYLFEDQYPNKPYQNEIKAEKDPDHLHGQNIISWASNLNAKQVVYHSIAHLPEKTHQELQDMLPEGHSISFDGMEI